MNPTKLFEFKQGFSSVIVREDGTVYSYYMATSEPFDNVVMLVNNVTDYRRNVEEVNRIEEENMRRQTLKVEKVCQE